MSKDLLIELGTEELPPKALKKLSDAFTQGIVDGLTEAGFEIGDVTLALKAWLLNYTGETEQAMLTINEALSINPSPSGSYFEVLGEIQFVQKQYHKSAETFEKVLERNPNYMRARMWLAAALAFSGDIEQAKWEAIELQVLNPNFSLSRLAFALPFKDPLKLEVVLRRVRLILFS